MKGSARPLKGFPFPFNVGTDICAVYRISAILTGPRASRFLTRIFASEEAQKPRDMLAELRPLWKSKDSGVEARTRRFTQHVAGRFAAKEAVIKAHSYRKLYYSDIVIESRRLLGASEVNQGSLIARIKGRGDEEDVMAMVSISHEDRYATAICLASDASVMESLPGYPNEASNPSIE